MDEREFELINIIGADLGANQRELSRLMNMSLGMMNMLIRRLVSKGFIRIEQLNKRKVQYLLTPKGFVEKMQKSVKYTLKTINSISRIKENLKKIVSSLYEAGEREFIILGKSDFALLVKDIFEELKLYNYKIIYVDDLQSIERKGMLLIAKESTEAIEWDPQKVMNLIHELAKFHDFNHNKELIKEKNNA